MRNKSFFIAILGTISQYYDHHLFAFLAAVFSKTFTPSSDPVIALLNTYFIMALAVCAKPIGALALGRIGDVLGRAVTLKISLLGSALATLIIAFTPGYSSIGIISTIILLFSRMVIVALVSSGTDGVRLYVYEHIGKDKQCLGNGLVQGSALVGTFIASASAWFFTLDIFPAYMWRMSVLLGSIIGFGMLLLVKSTDNSDITYAAEPEYDMYKNIPTLKIIYEHRKLFLICVLLAGSIGSTNHFSVLFFGTYVFKLLEYVPHSTMQFYTSVAIVVYIISSVVSGFLADMFGRVLIGAIGFVSTVIVAIILTIAIKNQTLPIMLYFLMMLFLPMMTMPALAFLKQSIPKSIRYRIFSLAHAIGSVLISSTTPMMATLMYKKLGYWVPMIHFIIILNIISISIHFLRKYYNADKY